MNLYHLRYFVTLAHLEHYTKAAEILSITQPSLSHAISSLESELGVKLFEKDGRNVVLTKCGQAFLADVEQALDMLDSSINKLQMTGFGEGRIDIVELRTLSSAVVPNFVKGFLDSTPNKKSIDLKEALTYPHIVFSKRSGLRHVIDKLFEKCGGYPQIAYSMEEDQGVAGLVSAGFGIAVVPRMPILSSLPVSIIEIATPSWERLFYFTASVRSYLPRTSSPASQAPWPGSCLRLENRESLRSGNQLQEAGSLHMP